MMELSQNTKTISSKQSISSKDTLHSKRRHSIAEEDTTESKRLCKDLELTNGLIDESGYDLLDESYNVACQVSHYRNHFPRHLIAFMYRLDLLLLCSLRKLIHENTYPSLSLSFEGSKIDKFNDIVIRSEKKIIHIKIENVDKYYIDNSIDYARLFTKEKQSFAINNYFDDFVEHVISKSDDFLNNIEYFIVYTNSRLDLTKENKLRKRRLKNFYPFKFENVNLEECSILKDFLFTNDYMQGRAFYNFSKENMTREELLKLLKFSSTMQKVLNEKEFPQGFETKIKEAFLDKLVFGVKQPNREELNSIVKTEIENNDKVKESYIALYEKMLCDLTTSKEHKKLANNIHGITYEFSLLTSFLHAMFLHRSMISINFEGSNQDASNDIVINYRGRVTYVKALNINNSIGYCQLFPFKQQEKKNGFSINKYFTFFMENLEKDIRYFIIYTNADLHITEEKELKRRHSKDFYPLKFNRIDIQKKRYKILRDCMYCINKNGLYQFSQEETTREKLFELLKLLPSLQKEKEEGRLSDEIEREIKEKFLNKIIFAINQPNILELNSIIREEIEKDNDILYNYEQLHEVALRWLESHEFGPITKGIMEELLEDIKNNRSSYRKIRKRNIDEEIKFAKSVVGREGTPAFRQFLEFLVEGEGKNNLEVMREKGINLSHMSSILSGAKANAIKAFKDLYNLWFDKEGNETQYLKTLEKEGIDLSSMSSILGGAGVNATIAFKDLYDLWFDKKGNRMQYLETLKKEGISDMSCVLCGARANAVTVFKNLYGLLFDKDGNKTQYLIILEKEGINLSNISTTLSGARVNAMKAFKDLCCFWFDTAGNKTRYLKTLEEEGINLSHMSSVLSGAKANAVKVFKNLFDLWFDEEGNKTQYLKSLEKEGINLLHIISILNGAATNADKTFKDLYDLWFDEEGNKKQYLITLKRENINILSVFNILHRAGSNAEKAFKELYDLWFDEEGNKNKYLKTLEKEGISLPNMSSILGGAGATAANAFKDLYHCWFDKQGNKRQCLVTLEREGVNLSDMCIILSQTGANAAKAFQDLYYLWFDEQKNKTQHLKHFIEIKDGRKSFTVNDLSSILSGTGTRAKIAFKNLHTACFNDEGEVTELLDDFYKADFKPSNLSCLLHKTGVRASSTLKRLHIICFNQKKEKTELLENFYTAGFRPYDLCNILSGAADSLEKFYNFCFIEETKIYLNHFLNEKESFTLRNICNILYGAGTNICSAFKDFHDVCFDVEGNRAQLLNDFYKTGFKPRDLSNVLSSSGNNASSILRNFHKFCFNKEEYLNHFLAETELFTPKILCKILHGVGLNIDSIFQQLHNFCFDNNGKKTKRLRNLMKNNQHEIYNILYEKVRETSSTSSNIVTKVR
ncbi:unnamed protein product [Xylocopa violacea]|uniref:Uncharacterized protein n=1 Tax=Xylocopa violacea TaxID=135666 RepID=A0ABP1NXG2_XYLVO